MKFPDKFQLSELIYSETAEKNQIINNPNNSQKQNLYNIANDLLKPLRIWYKKPIIISSGFRSKKLNEVLTKTHSASKVSQHMDGEAVDILKYSKDLKKVYKYIIDNLEFDQLILEYNTWIHVSYRKNRNRKQCLIFEKKGGKKIRRNYIKGEF